MKSFVLCFIALLFPSFSHARPVAATPLSKLDQVCKDISFEGLSVDTCRSVFLHDPQSRTADDAQRLRRILVNITTNAGKESVAGMRNTLHRLRTALTPEQVSAVQKCIHNYEEAIYSVQVASDLVTKSGEVSFLVGDVLDVARHADGSCQGALDADKGKGLKAAAYIRKYRLFFPSAITVLTHLI